jgi:hypothetical protein
VLGVAAGRGVPSREGGPGITLRENTWNFHAKSCILGHFWRVIMWYLIMVSFNANLARNIELFLTVLANH